MYILPKRCVLGLVSTHPKIYRAAYILFALALKVIIQILDKCEAAAIACIGAVEDEALTHRE